MASKCDCITAEKKNITLRSAIYDCKAITQMHINANEQKYIAFRHFSRIK